MTSTIRSHGIARRRAPRVGLLGLLRSILATRQQRHTLAELDEAMLRDIGLTRADALRESQRPLWDVPNAWRK